MRARDGEGPVERPTADPRPDRSPEARPRRLRDWSAVVTDRIRETCDTVTLMLFTGHEPHAYRAGQFVTLDPRQLPALGAVLAYLEHEKGHREPPRAYSLSSAPHEPQLALTVKQEYFEPGRTRYPPLLSPLLVHHVRPGDRLRFRGFTGGYVLPEDLEARTRHVVHLCAGSGIIPNYAMIKSDLARDSQVRHTLVYGSRTWDDVIFRDGLEVLAARHPGRLRVVHALSREPDLSRCCGEVRPGRITADLVRELVPNASEAEFFCCGPGLTRWDRERARERGESPEPRFIEAVSAHLDALGVDEARIHRESYG